MSLTSSGTRILGAWETAGQVYFGATDTKGPRIPSPIAAPGDAGTRKHPRLAANPNGDVLFAWTEGTAWARGGSVAWQMFDAAGRTMDVKGQAPGVPVWSFAAPIARADGGSVLILVAAPLELFASARLPFGRQSPVMIRVRRRGNHRQQMCGSA